MWFRDNWVWVVVVLIVVLAVLIGTGNLDIAVSS